MVTPSCASSAISMPALMISLSISTPSQSKMMRSKRDIGAFRLLQIPVAGGKSADAYLPRPIRGPA